MTNYQRPKDDLKQVEAEVVSPVGQKQMAATKSIIRAKGGPRQNSSTMIGIQKHSQLQNQSTAYDTEVGANHTLFGSSTAGDILNYPNNFDETKAQEVTFEDQIYKAAAHSKYPSMHPSGLEQPAFPKAKELAQAFCDMCVMEANLEKKRRELALCPDFNLCDVYKMFL